MSNRLPKELEAAWKEAEASPGKAVDIGRMVICDHCSVDYTDLPDSGGFIFGSYGCCPKCAPGFLEKIQKYHEEGYIRSRCPPGKSYADFIREYRGPDGNKVTIHHGGV